MADLALNSDLQQRFLTSRGKLDTPQIEKGTNRVKEGVGHTERLKKACRDFESLFINYLLKEMRATIKKSSFLDGGRAEELYTSMMDNQTAKELSASGGIGIAQMLYRQLTSDTGTIEEKQSRIDPGEKYREQT